MWGLSFTRDQGGGGKRGRLEVEANQLKSVFPFGYMGGRSGKYLKRGVSSLTPEKKLALKTIFNTWRFDAAMTAPYCFRRLGCTKESLPSSPYRGKTKLVFYMFHIQNQTCIEGVLPCEQPEAARKQFERFWEFARSVSKAGEMCWMLVKFVGAFLVKSVGTLEVANFVRCLVRFI